ncbi:MAG: hypothetical protein JST87_15565 [Bacteroidetes bacterium]|nr:hypothetical protein [Bacteroidota bacterium]
MEKKIKVYVTCWWIDDENLFDIIKSYGFGKTIWKNVEFTLDDDFDRIIILRGLNNKSKKYDATKAITFFTEPNDCAENLNHESGTILSFIAIPWWNSVRNKMKNHVAQSGGIKKTKLLSSVTSDKYFLPGHQKRIDFLILLDKTIEDGLDIYGHDSSGELRKILNSYKKYIVDKYDGLWAYKYHFACENSFIPFYYTEKIVDPIIAEALCFYDGCPNISEFIDDRAYVKIDLDFPVESVSTIIEHIQNNAWKKRIKFIRHQKLRFLSDLNPLNLIWAAVNEMDVYKIMRL